MNEREAAALRRTLGVRAVSDRPSQRHAPGLEGRGGVLGRIEVRSVEIVERDGRVGVLVGGFASVTEQPYEMWDMFGAYMEVVSLDAFDKTLGQDPLVEFTLNHNRGGGLPMAHTRNGTLVLTVVKDGEVTGLLYEAFVDPERSDVADMLKALERGDLAEASFKFYITAGQWSPDYLEYRINEVDLDRGDVSAVNFGANPNATSGLREQVEVPPLVTPRRSAPTICDEDVRLRIA